ncbi:hypothetical protein CEUSTIGMA_g10286.t1 [Chlamydomonas eustigma]|uniref:Uncharacterized protein n=1 Tax=Chlamydomonas eustigma TaxID=1157962 RepID=A0A250XJ84_9CHLO|nr:hypothetical protein CEUSTIGMA_g10286.t1 [Chlamydomonas eustigma]|eukprot:GAX82860.1 hypothetical protein CEUSTIGMA_g10286.t1 [Chlamydomonas eustigma]
MKLEPTLRKLNLRGISLVMPVLLHRRDMKRLVMMLPILRLRNYSRKMKAKWRKPLIQLHTVKSIDILADGKLVYKTSYVSMLGPKTRQSLDIKAARRSAVRCGSQSQASVVSRSSTDSQNYVWTHGARHYDSESASDLDRIGHLVRLITKGRPLNEVLEDMKETNARLGRQGIYMKNHMIRSGAVGTG